MESTKTMEPTLLLYALAGTGLGILTLVYGDFALQWQPLPAWLPGRPTLAYVSGVWLLVGSCGILIRRTALVSAMSLAIYQVIWAVAKAAPVAQHPLIIAMWLGFCESVAFVVGAWLLVALIKGRDTTRVDASLLGSRGIACARVVFGICCVVFGLSHFAYADFSATMIPDWLPGHLTLVYLTGAAHVMAGMAIGSGVLSRLAATLEAAMMTSIVLLVHVPSLVDMPPPIFAPTSRVQWTALLIALSLAASSWIVAASLREPPWGWKMTTKSVAFPNT